MKPEFSTSIAMAETSLGYRGDGILYKASHYADDMRMRSHSHEYAHLVFNLSGNITQNCRKKEIRFEASSIVFLPLDETHSTHFQNGVRTFQIILDPKWIERFQQNSERIDSPLSFTNGPATWLAMRLYQEFKQQDNLKLLMLEGLTLELLAVMSRQGARGSENHPPVWLKQARDLLNDRFSESLSVEEIATAVGVHPSHLMESFRKHYHCTLGDYVRGLRVEYAAHLLSASDLPASQIAQDAGFADQSHFSRTFKKITGMTPKQFQKASS